MAKLSYTMREYMRRIHRAGEAGLLDYAGRTTDALERRGFVTYRLPEGQTLAFTRWVWRLTDAGRKALGVE